MRKLILKLISIYGMHHNSLMNEIATTWYQHQFTLNELAVSLKDIDQDVVVARVEQAIETFQLKVTELRDVVLIPKLARNCSDLDIEVVVLPNVLQERMLPAMKVEFDFWCTTDKVSLGGAEQHITIKKGKGSKSREGAYLNATCTDGHLFSTSFDAVELPEVMRTLVQERFNGVVVGDELLSQLVLSKLFYRLIDSDIGFKLEMEHPELYQVMHAMVWPEEITQDDSSDRAIYSSWGAKIGMAYQEFTAVDRLAAQSQTKTPLHIVTEKAPMTTETDESDTDSEVMTEWGSF